MRAESRSLRGRVRPDDRVLDRILSVLARWHQFARSTSVESIPDSSVPQCCVVRDGRSLCRGETTMVRRARGWRQFPVADPADPPDQEDGAHLPRLPRSFRDRVRAASSRTPGSWREPAPRRRRARDPIGPRSGQRRVLADGLAVPGCELRFNRRRAGRTHNRLRPCRPPRASRR